jgi:DNA-binding transcriptional LysR family regulator
MLAESDLHEARLVTPLALRAPLQSSYYLVCAESDVAHEGVAAFREWLLAEAAKETETA